MTVVVANFSSPVPKQPETPRSPPPTADVVRPPPAGTREIDIVPASDLRYGLFCQHDFLFCHFKTSKKR